ncbi:murein transglycosylase A [Sphingomonas sp. HF-S4]|uniref:peptidoglycan lytic exotransglycosylase n=1 Tax=Sphingomonas agrestis TaxID=3080540 RepID=A0ABU3Y7R6_9SPHN|nr:murein transglycosylase A [Sphingomonas sp. HF-S4]MDV3457443.1 murein transglycosylase A [Sphingomonas sp. HF-S4]
MRLWGTVALAALLSACSGGIVPPEAGVSRAPAPSPAPAPRDTPRSSLPETPVHLPARQPTAATPLAAMPALPVPASATTARTTGVVAGPALNTLPIGQEGAERALAAYKLSCTSLQRRTDSTGLTQGADWAESCRAASSWPTRDARGFFVRHFDTVQIGDGKAFATGYYEPEIHGCRERRSGCEVPIYGVPTDLIDVDLGLFSDDLKGKKIRGRVEGKNFVPYFDRTAIEQGRLDGRAPVIAYANDPVEIFFLQVQGSGRLRLPDGGVMRIGYAGQNGRDYTGIGKLMKDRGLLGPGQTSMQGIMAYLRQNPEEGRAIMRENKSFVFFKELTGAGPLGAMGLPVAGWTSAAVDPKFVPLGAPAFLSMDRTDATGLWVAQDTGGAIKGANRFDTFWGAGDDARAIAGGMSARGVAWLLLPKAVVMRLTAAPVTP